MYYFFCTLHSTTMVFFLMYWLWSCLFSGGWLESCTFQTGMSSICSGETACSCDPSSRSFSTLHKCEFIQTGLITSVILCFVLILPPLHHCRPLCKHVTIFTLFRALLSSRRPVHRLKTRRKKMKMMTLTCLVVMRMMKRQRKLKNRGWKSTQRRRPKSPASSPSLPSYWM